MVSIGPFLCEYGAALHIQLYPPDPHWEVGSLPQDSSVHRSLVMIQVFIISTISAGLRPSLIAASTCCFRAMARALLVSPPLIW